MSSVDLYEQLKHRLGEGESRALINYMDEKIRGEVATKEDLLILKNDLEKQILGVRGEIQGVRGEIQGLRGEMQGEIQGLRGEMQGEIQGLRGEIQVLRGEMKDENWKLRVLVIVVLVLQIVLNPKIVELVGKVLGIVK